MFPDPASVAFIDFLGKEFPGILHGGTVTVDKTWLKGIWLIASQKERAACAKVARDCYGKLVSDKWEDQPKAIAQLIEQRGS